MKKNLCSLAAISLVFTSIASAAVIQVGPDREIKKPSAASAIAKDGDIIEIDAATYIGDVTTWKQNDINIRSRNGRALLRAAGKAAEQKAIWVIKGDRVSITGIEFEGAKVRDKNGAGIRAEGNGLTIKNCYFHHNENGILTGRFPESNIVIEYSEFGHNGHGDGQSHNLYVGEVKSLTLRFNYFHHARIGHQIKSRAHVNHILYNRIMDEKTGDSSYLIDVPDGGLAYIIGNSIQQGPDTDNYAMISYGTNFRNHPVNGLYVINNTLVNDRLKGGIFVVNASPVMDVRVANNIMAGKGKPLKGKGAVKRNLTEIDPLLMSPADYDYQLRARSRAVNRGLKTGSAHDIPLIPAFEYVHPMHSRPRHNDGALDIGAYEYTSH